MDVDGVVADLVGELCAEVSFFGHPCTPDDVTHYEFEHCLPPIQVDIMRRAMRRVAFCQHLPWYPGGREFVTALREAGDLVAVTKPYPEGATWAWERAAWLQSGKVHKVIQTGHKEYVSGDWLIEDSITNAERWLARNAGAAIIIDRPWNRIPLPAQRCYRAVSYSAALKILAGQTWVSHI